MTLPIAGALRSEFKHRSDEICRQRLLHMQREELQRKDKQDREADSDAAELQNMIVSIVATEEIEAFRIELETYEAATVEALQENTEQLEAVKDRLGEIFAKAHVLEDGRRIFKTEDGLRVFDEHGTELDSSEIDPAEIADELERWEPTLSLIDQKEMLELRRAKILDYQEKLDDARTRLDAGDISQSEFDKLKSDLTENMPDEVRAHVPGMENTQSADPSQGMQTAYLAEDLDIAARDAPGAMKLDL